MEKIGWKVLALVFIGLFVAETIVVVWAWSIGYKAISNEELCASKCMEMKDGNSYQYDMYTDKCSCFGNMRNVIATFDTKDLK